MTTGATAAGSVLGRAARRSERKRLTDSMLGRCGTGRPGTTPKAGSAPETVDDALDLERVFPHGEEGLAEEDGLTDHAIEEVFEVTLNDGERVFELDGDIHERICAGGFAAGLIVVAEGDADVASGLAEADRDGGYFEVAVVAPCVAGELEGDAGDGGPAAEGAICGEGGDLAVAEDGFEFSAEDAALGAEEGFGGVVGEDDAVGAGDHEAGVGEALEDLFHAGFEALVCWVWRIRVFGGGVGCCHRRAPVNPRIIFIYAKRLATH